MSILKEEPWLSASKIRQRLRENGVVKPYNTVSRYLENMKSVGLIREDDGKYTIDMFGVLILDLIENMRRFQVFIERLNVPIPSRINVDLPAVILKKFCHFSDSELVLDIFSGLSIFLDIIYKAEKEVKIAMIDIADELLEVLIEKNIEGKLILETRDKPHLKDSDFDVKFTDILPFQTFIGDGRVACIQFVDSRERMYTPFIIPSSEDGIILCNDIFDYYWSSI